MKRIASLPADRKRSMFKVIVAFSVPLAVLYILFKQFALLRASAKHSAELSMVYDYDSFWKAQNRLQSKATIAYAITVTQCPSSASWFVDGAAVLAYSIHTTSIRNPASGSRYDYKLYAFVNEDAIGCSQSFANLGYDIQVRPVPVNRTKIRGPLKEHVDGGCCGEKEFLKLYAYTLVEHPVVVHLDADALLLKPLDDLYDSMLEGPDSPARSRLPTMWINHTSQLPDEIDAFFTRDYNMMALVGKYKREVHESAVQGGFLVIRPNHTMYEIYRELIIEGDYVPDTGWGHSKGLKFGGFYGAAQIQGICSYVFGHVRPENSVELNRCLINNMLDSPYERRNASQCRFPTKCDDCRLANYSNIMSIHFTLCTKPWKCRSADTLAEEIRELCGAFHNKWYRYRHEMETAWSSRDELHNTTAVRLGRGWVPEEGRKTFCDRDNRYIPILYPDLPLGQLLSNEGTVQKRKTLE